MSWRPEGWINPFDTEKDKQLGKHWGRARDYEDGADAMLEALKAKGTWFDEPVEPFARMKGYIVFIEGEKPQDITEGRQG